MNPVSRLWKARETFVGKPNWPGGHRCPYCGRKSTSTPCYCIDPRNPNAVQQEHIDGIHVHGRFPPGFLAWIFRNRLLGEVPANDVLHVCSGSLREPWTADVRAEVKPRIVADGAKLPFRDGSFRAVLIDPPYSDDYARNLYGTENPRPSHLLREACRIVEHQGRFAILHVAVPMTPPGADFIDCFGVTTGAGFRIRALTVYEKRQATLFELRDVALAKGTRRGTT